MRLGVSRFLHLSLAIGALTVTLSRPASAQLTDLGTALLNDCAGSLDCLGSVILQDSFGEVTATGDFNADGFADLAVGNPRQGKEDGQYIGTVRVFYGAADGLSNTRTQLLRRTTCDDPSVTFTPGEYVASLEFGSALAAGDFDGDGAQDLAIGIPGATVTVPGWLGIPSARAYAGAVCVVFGQKGKNLDTDRTVSLHQGNLSYRNWGPTEEAEGSDSFGESLTACRSKSGTYRLVVGAPGEWLGVTFGAGIVMEINVNPSSDDFRETRFLHQDVEGVEGTAAKVDRFGSTLACGDFNGDGHHDLAVGTPSDAVGGTVQIFYRNSGGLKVHGNQLFHQGSAGIEGKAERGDNFGEALAVGDFDGSGVADLAIGVPGENGEQHLGEGMVTVLYGRPDVGLSGEGSDSFSQATSGIPGAPESEDNFGRSLAAGNFDGNDIFDMGSNGVHPIDDLAVGVLEAMAVDGSGEEQPQVGMVHILRGSRLGILGALSDHQLVDRRLPRHPAPAPRAFHRFGYTLAAGDFDGNGSADLASTVSHLSNRALIDVFYGLRRSWNAFGNISFEANGTSVPEGNTPVEVRVRRTGGAPIPASIDYHVATTQALPGTDYVPVGNGTLTWAAGELGSKSFHVMLREDTADEPDERIRLELLNATEGATSPVFSNLRFDLTIVDDDVPTPTPTPTRTPTPTGTPTATPTRTPTPTPTAPALTISVNGSLSPLTVPRAAVVTVRTTNGPANPSDWVGLYRTAETSPNQFLSFQYLDGTSGAPPTTGGRSSATLNFTMPIEPGTYDFRFFPNNTFDLLARSAVVTVQ